MSPTAIDLIPTNQAITKRNLRFPVEECDLLTWHQDGPQVTHFFNALSIFFPEGESFFIDSVRHYADAVRSPKLIEEMAGFGGQEAIHSREHRRYNRALAEAGLPIRDLEAIVDSVLSAARRLTSPAQQLAVTIALEHFTAIMARVLLEKQEDLFGGADPRMAALWRWHAAEESEHKSVAYDVYGEVRGQGLGAYLERSLVMLFATAIFWPLVFVFHLRLVRSARATGNLGGWGRLFRRLFIAPGLFPRIALPWLSYFRPGFHPAQHDSSRLVEAWKASGELGAATSA